jgi:hypothetical protein
MSLFWGVLHTTSIGQMDKGSQLRNWWRKKICLLGLQTIGGWPKATLSKMPTWQPFL